MVQEQFLNVIDVDEAERRFREAIRLEPLGAEEVPLNAALGRVLAADVVAEVDVPSFDRSNYDGYALRAADTYGAEEEQPRALALLDETLATGVVPQGTVEPGRAVAIATGAMLPRGADAVVMVEHTDEVANLKGTVPFSRHTGPAVGPAGAHAAKIGTVPQAVEHTDDHARTLLVRRAVVPGHGVAFAGSDIAAGETVLWRGQVLTSRETGVLAAVGRERVAVRRRPAVAILSTGDEIIAPGRPMRPPLVYDSNARILADAVRELGGEPLALGIVPDRLDVLREKLRAALQRADAVLLSGGTSKGEGDLSYRAVAELDEPGIVAHGGALKPGKPICLAAHRGKPVVILPGFPTSAIFTFHQFVAPVLRRLAGLPAEQRNTLRAAMAVKVNSEIGRTEYLLVGLVEAGKQMVAYPMGKGSGSVTTFSRADGFITIARQEEIVEAGAARHVQLLGRELRPADLVVIGSHCVGLDMLLGKLQERGFTVKFLAVGSTAGLEAARRAECDLAGIHLLDPATGRYNDPFVDETMELVCGYGRLQGIVFRPGDPRFEGRDAREAVARAKQEANCVMVNRNAGSGTRILIDRLLGGVQPAGYAVQAKSHNAVAAAVAQGRADWGVAVEWVARRGKLGFLPLEREQYDFAIPKARLARPGVAAFRNLLAEADVREELRRFLE